MPKSVEHSGTTWLFQASDISCPAPDAATEVALRATGPTMFVTSGGACRNWSCSACTGAGPATAAQVTKVRVRFENPTQQKQAYFDITLKDNKSAVAIERIRPRTKISVMQ